MQALKQKIQHTSLFSDEDKIAILAAVDGYTPEDIKALEGIVDEFDTKHREAISEYKKSVATVLAGVVAKAAPSDQIKFKEAASLVQSGVDELLQ